jgi:hypothetical protein
MARVRKELCAAPQAGERETALLRPTAALDYGCLVFSSRFHAIAVPPEAERLALRQPNENRQLAILHEPLL